MSRNNLAFTGKSSGRFADAPELMESQLVKLACLGTELAISTVDYVIVTRLIIRIGMHCMQSSTHIGHPTTCLYKARFVSSPELLFIASGSRFSRLSG